MKSNFNFFNNAFLKISGIKKIDLSNYIVIKNSKNVKISDNYINNSITYFFDGFAPKSNNCDTQTKIDIKFESSIVNDKTERALLNNDYIERFIFECNKKKIIPTIRCYAFFSHISSIRSRSDVSEYNQLILAEKDLFDSMLEHKFRVKLIISLDIPMILTKWYDNISETICRLTDLSDKVDSVYQNNNIEIVVDEINSLDGQFILHDNLFIHALNADPIHKYNITKYETEYPIIQNAIKIFDERFRYLSLTNNIVKKHIRLSTMSSFIKKTVECRLEDLNRNFSVQKD